MLGAEKAKGKLTYKSSQDTLILKGLINAYVFLLLYAHLLLGLPLILLRPSAALVFAMPCDLDESILVRNTLHLFLALYLLQ